MLLMILAAQYWLLINWLLIKKLSVFALKLGHRLYHMKKDKRNKVKC